MGEIISASCLVFEFREFSYKIIENMLSSQKILPRMHMLLDLFSNVHNLWGLRILSNEIVSF